MTAKHDYSAICKQLGSGYDAEYRSKLFDNRPIFSPNKSHIEALWILMQKKNLADDNLFGGLRVKILLIRASTLFEMIIIYYGVSSKGYSTGFK